MRFPALFKSALRRLARFRAFRAVDRETTVLRTAAEDLARRTMAVLRLAFLSTAVLEFFSTVSIALLAVYIGFKLLGVFPFPTGEDFTLQKGMMILVLAPEFFVPIRRLSALHHDRADAVSAAGMLSEWLARDLEPPLATGATCPRSGYRIRGRGTRSCGWCACCSGCFL